MRNGVVDYILSKIEYVDEAGIFIDGAFGDYSFDSVYRFSLINGISINNYSKDFKLEIIRFANYNDKLRNKEGQEISP